jgi:hypothetical protein
VGGRDDPEKLWGKEQKLDGEREKGGVLGWGEGG